MSCKMTAKRGQGKEYLGHKYLSLKPTPCRKDCSEKEMMYNLNTMNMVTLSCSIYCTHKVPLKRYHDLDICFKSDMLKSFLGVRLRQCKCHYKQTK